MTDLKIQEIKNYMRNLWDNFSDKRLLCEHMLVGYVDGTYGTNECIDLDYCRFTIVPEIEQEIIDATPVILNKEWFDHTCSQRIYLNDEAVKNIAINALTLIQYVQENNLNINTVHGGAHVYVNYINPEHQSIFEAFGGYVEYNPYPTTTQLEDFTVVHLNAFKELHMLEVEGWNEMLKAEKLAQLKHIIYGIEL